MNIRLRNTLALILTVAVTFISYFGAIPAQAQTLPLTVRNVVALTNADRSSLGTSSLSEDALLNKAAQAKADDMAAKGYFSHIDPSGNQPWKWFKSVGYYYTRAGENLAVNFDDAGSLNTAWMNSPGHRANIIKGAYTKVGIGIAHGVYQGKPATFVVQFFATPYVAKVALR